MLYHMPITCSSCVCHITYVQESREVVVFRLLDKIVATELVSPTVQSKVVPYVQRHGLNVDEVLLQYVKVGNEYGKGGYSLVSGFCQLLVVKSWMGTRLGVKWWLRWIVRRISSPTTCIQPSLPAPSSSISLTSNHVH